MSKSTSDMHLRCWLIRLNFITIQVKYRRWLTSMLNNNLICDEVESITNITY